MSPFMRSGDSYNEYVTHCGVAVSRVGHKIDALACG
ncbi:hypothetical protein FMEAI12_3770010 [Parafrankia sp. Ea1.12]|nr:hypothetical protein FMEAI12_3770010 [Parafrankia sp. Ea1.12]